MTLTVSMTRTEQRAGFLYLLLQLFLLPNLLSVLNDTAGVPLNPAQLNFIFFSINFLSVTLIFRKFLLKTLRHTGSRIFLCLRTAFIGFFLYYLSTLILGLLLQHLSPDFSNVNDQGILAMARDNYTLMAIGTIILVPFTEEVFYRGLIFRQLHVRSRILAYTVSTFVFCCIHVVGYVGAYAPVTLLLCFVQYIPAGICLAWVYERSDTLVAPILVHMTVNQVSLSAMR